MDDPFYPNLIIHTNVIQMFSLFTFVYAGLQISLKIMKKAPEHGVIFMFLSK